MRRLFSSKQQPSVRIRKVFTRKFYIIKDSTGDVPGEVIDVNRDTLLTSFIASSSTETFQNIIVAISLVPVSNSKDTETFELASNVKAIFSIGGCVSRTFVLPDQLQHS